MVYRATIFHFPHCKNSSYAKFPIKISKISTFLMFSFYNCTPAYIFTLLQKRKNIFGKCIFNSIELIIT